MLKRKYWNQAARHPLCKRRALRYWFRISAETIETLLKLPPIPSEQPPAKNRMNGTMSHGSSSLRARIERFLQPSLCRRLIALSLTLSVTLMWSLALFSSAIQRKEFSQVLLTQQSATTRQIAAEIDNKLQERIRALAAAAHDFPVDLSAATLAAEVRRFSDLQRIFSGGVAVIGLDGRALFDYPEASGRRGIYVGDRDYYTNVVQTGRAYVGRPWIGRVFNRPVLTIAVPILDKTGKMRAVLSGVTDLTAPNFLGFAFDRAMSGQGLFFVISPHDNIIVASTDPQRVMTAPPTPGRNLLYDRFVAGFEGSGIATSSGGEEKLFSANRVPTADWLVVASLPSAVAFEPIASMRNYLIGTVAILTLLAVLLAYILTRRMLVPLEEAGRAVRQMTRGDCPLAPLPVKSNDEVGGLIDDFNTLIEDRVRREAALADSEQRFRVLVENAPDAVFLEAHACFTYVNAAACRLFGAQTADQLLGQPIVARIHLDSRARVEAHIQAVNAAREPLPPMEVKMLQIDGSSVYAEVSAVPYQHANANGGLIFARDVTARKRAEDALRESERRFQRLVALSSEWYWECDKDLRVTRITGWNAEPEESLSQQIIGKNGAEIGVSFPDAGENHQQALMAARLPFSDLEVMQQKQDGTSVWHSVNGEPLFTEDGIYLGYYGTAKDITERKLAEEALRDSEAHIRELAIHQEEIKERERKRIARDIHDDLGQTLLTLRIDALMIADEVRDVRPDVHNTVRLMLGNIDNAIKSIKTIINDLRPFVLDLGLAAALEWQVQEFERSCGIECALDMDNEHFDRFLDEATSIALFRIAQESLTNVRRHAHASRVYIQVRTSSDRLAMTIRDNGIGLATKGHQKVSFGLAGMEERVIALGGNFTIDSEQGKGTTLLISVPIAGAYSASYMVDEFPVWPT